MYCVYKVIKWKWNNHLISAGLVSIYKNYGNCKCETWTVGTRNYMIQKRWPFYTRRESHQNKKRGTKVMWQSKMLWYCITVFWYSFCSFRSPRNCIMLPASCLWYHSFCLCILLWTDKVCDAVEVAGKNVMSTTSVVTTGLVSQR